MCPQWRNCFDYRIDETYVNEDPTQIKLQRHYRAEFKSNVAERKSFPTN